LVIAEGIHTGGDFVHSETTATLLRKLGAEPSPPVIPGSQTLLSARPLFSDLMNA
jgi:hypothetical protein